MSKLTRRLSPLVLALGLACAPSQTEPPASTLTAPAERAPEAAACADVPATGPFTRAVPGAERGCAKDTDCVSVANRCGACADDCAGVHVSAASRYDEAPMACEGYSGPVCNYDCRVHSLGRCVEGCCASAPWYELGLEEPPKWEDSRLAR